MKEIWILGIHITDRVMKTSDVQRVLSKYGCSIKTRLGLHEVTDEHCSEQGIILLELCGTRDEAMKLENELLAIEGLNVKKMVF